MSILVLNAGSSTLKASVFHPDHISSREPSDAFWSKTFDWTGENADAARVFDLLVKDLPPIAKVGHRVVHGGAQLIDPTPITAEVKRKIQELSSLAPLHNPLNLKGIELAERAFPHALQVAVFDTAFHQSMPIEAKKYPLPKVWQELGIQRYGFHGINHQYCFQRCSQILKSSSLKIVTCHLGNGASLAAIQDFCRFTTMGFTPCEGLMMGTRSGSIDPTIPLYLLQKGYSGIEVDKMLNQESGLKGICQTRDMREILERQDEDAQLAVKMYLHSLQYHLGGCIGVLEGLDALVFTAGIGENSPQIRQDVCNSLRFLGLEMDEYKNKHCQPDEEISTQASKVRVLVIKAREDWAIAVATHFILV